MTIHCVWHTLYVHAARRYVGRSEAEYRKRQDGAKVRSHLLAAVSDLPVPPHRVLPLTRLHVRGRIHRQTGLSLRQRGP